MNGGHFSSNVVGLAIQSCSTPCDPMDCSPPGSSVHGISQYTGVGGLSLLQGICQTRGSNPSRLHYRLILYHLSH